MNNFQELSLEEMNLLNGGTSVQPEMIKNDLLWVFIMIKPKG